MTDLVLLVELILEPGQTEAFMARVATHRENVLKNEPGCRRFEVLTPHEGENRVFLYEVYADQAALDHHMTTPYMKQYLDDTSSMIAQRNRNLCDLTHG
ncbi:MAG: antibiotic biosynthesis monooxygenase [Kiloniellales bacterium]|nr:antibiotic biosynthesis monooxygenase [Kiloniellales bacterium]